MRLYCFLGLLIFFFNCFSQKNELIWDSDLKLKWSDFRGSVNDTILTSNSMEPNAVSFIGFSLQYLTKNNRLELIIKTYFDMNESYYRDTLQAKLLEHEQCHFDIAELYVRKMRRSIKLLQQKGIFDRAKFSKIIDSLDVARMDENRQFDEDTFYGTFLADQEKWVTKIKEELLELKEYSYENCYLTLAELSE